MLDHTLVFVGGLHRSGTTLLARCLAEHPSISGFHDTAVPADEGQHLQSVYPRAKVYGGPGLFGFSPAAHLTEASPLASGESRWRLFAEWSPYWDLEKPFLVEKSPPNLTKTRFLQRLFPGSYFLVLLRHPIPVTLATAKWRRTRRYHRLLEHWLVCHELFAEDRRRLERVHVLSYEELVGDPVGALGRIYDFLGLERRAPGTTFDLSSNRRYFARWRELGRPPLMRAYLAFIGARYERRVNAFGYSLHDLNRHPVVVPAGSSVGSSVGWSASGLACE